MITASLTSIEECPDETSNLNTCNQKSNQAALIAWYKIFFSNKATRTWNKFSKFFVTFCKSLLYPCLFLFSLLEVSTKNHKTLKKKSCYKYFKDNFVIKDKKWNNNDSSKCTVWLPQFSLTLLIKFWQLPSKTQTTKNDNKLH